MNKELDSRVQRAVEYFMQGYGCGQSVAAAFCDLYGLTPEQAFRIGAGFGGGVGKMRMMCGAVSGMVILAGLEDGQHIRSLYLMHPLRQTVLLTMLVLELKALFLRMPYLLLPA